MPFALAPSAWVSVSRTRWHCRSSTTTAPSRRSSTAMALPESFELKGKTIVVTGGSRGIGLEFVKQLLAKGNTVIPAVRNPEASTVQELKNANPKCIPVALDVGDLSSIQAWASKLAEVSPSIDVLINNSGVLYGDSFDSVSPDAMLESYKVGSITENGSGRNYAYRCSKIAANMAVKSMSIDLAPKGITSTILHPGYVRTDMTGGSGLIDVAESVKGMIDVLESKDKPLNGEWYHTSGRHLPW